MTKKGLLTKAERTALEKLLNDSQFKGKKWLRFLIWLNTTKPKYKNGECFKVSDPSHRLFGVQAINVNAKIVEVKSFMGEHEYIYTLEAHVVNKDGRELTTSMYAPERLLQVKVKNNENRIDGTSRFAESIDVDLFV